MVRGAAAGARLPDARRHRVGRGRRDHLVPARRVRRAGAQGLGHHLSREDEPLDRAAADPVFMDHPAVHRHAQLEREPGRAPPRDPRHDGGARAHPLAGGNPDARGPEPAAGRTRRWRRPDAGGRVRVQRKDGPRGDDPAHRHGRPAARPDARGGGRPGGRGGPLALSGVPRIARRHRRAGARQGHPRRGALGEGWEAAGRAPPRRVRPRHPGGRGRAHRHEAPEDPSRDRARRVRRHRGPRHHGRSAGGDRRPDLRRVRPTRRGREASRDAGCRVAARGLDAAPGRERHFRARARRGRLHDDRRLPVRSAGPAPQGGRPGRGSGRRVRDRGDGRAPGGRRAARRPGGDVKLRSTIAPIPPGALDLAGEAVRRRRTLQRAALEQLGAAGYEEIIPPTFEYAEGFIRPAGAADLADRLIPFFDLDGKLLALRYDFTASVARLAATKLADRPTPLRLCYSGAVFRQDPERANGGGRPREILQVGAELLGDAGIAADVEVLRLALELVRRASPKEYQVNLGHAGALAPALDALPPEERTRVRRLIDRKDAAGLATAAPGSLTELPFIIGRREALDRAARVAPDARVAIDRLREIDAALADEERRHVVYDFGEVRGLDYYTGMHFEIFVTGAGSAVGAGGRYDDLMGRFGRPLPAVGLALDLEDRKSTRLNSSHSQISYAVFCLKKKKTNDSQTQQHPRTPGTLGPSITSRPRAAPPSQDSRLTAMPTPAPVTAAHPHHSSTHGAV